VKFLKEQFMRSEQQWQSIEGDLKKLLKDLWSKTEQASIVKEEKPWQAL
jgi:hypothetical protein